MEMDGPLSVADARVALHTLDLDRQTAGGVWGCDTPAAVRAWLGRDPLTAPLSRSVADIERYDDEDEGDEDDGPFTAAVLLARPAAELFTSASSGALSVSRDDIPSTTFQLAASAAAVG